MATSDHDDALQYLLSKLQSDDGWSCANLAWNKDRLTVIVDQFSNFDGSVKSKLLLSFLAMSPRVIANCRDEMYKLLRLARRDSDEWVRLLSSVLGSFPTDQYIVLTDDSNANDILQELSDTLINSNSISSYSPHELPYLSQSVLSEQIHYTPNIKHHFNLRQTPRASTQLRNDVLHRAEIDFAQTGSLIRDRMLQRQSSTTTGSTVSKSFVSSSSTTQRSSLPIKTGLMQRRHRQKGTKLLEIDEVPLAGGRKKRKSSVLEVDTPNKKVATPTLSIPLTPSSPFVQTPSLTTPTPDYAAALATDDTPSYNTVPTTTSTATVTNNKESFSAEVIQSILSNPSDQSRSQSLQRDVIEERQRLLQQMQGTTTTPATPTDTTPSVTTVKQPTTNRLKLSRQQLAVAQEIFREAPHLNKQQKALILAFMAGSRDNPLPGHNVISLKLNQRTQQEYVQSTDGEGEKILRTVQLETVFEMNYNTGQWRKLQVKRPVPNNSSTATITPPS